MHLTPRERSLLAAILQGRSNKEIAARDGLSEQTVRNRLAGLYRKFGVHSRLQLAVAALKRHVAAREE